MEPKITTNESKLNELSEKIIGASFEVSNFSKPRVDVKRIVRGIGNK